MPAKIIIAVARTDGRKIIQEPCLDPKAFVRLMKDIKTASTTAETTVRQNGVSEPQGKERVEDAGTGDQVSPSAIMGEIEAYAEKVKEQIDKFNAISAQVRMVTALSDESFDQSKAIHLARRLIKAEFGAYVLCGELNKVQSTGKVFSDYKNMVNKLNSVADGYRAMQDDLRRRFLLSAHVPACGCFSNLVGGDRPTFC